MASPGDIKRLGNITSSLNNPVPRIVIPGMPAKLSKIDPDGCAKYETDLQEKVDEWSDKLSLLVEDLQKRLVTLENPKT